MGQCQASFSARCRARAGRRQGAPADARRIFHPRPPGIDVRLDAGLGNRNLAREGFDLAIRYSPLGAAQGKQLFAESMLPVCSPSLAGKLGLPRREPPDLARHTLLHLSMGGDSSRAP